MPFYPEVENQLNSIILFLWVDPKSSKIQYQLVKVSMGDQKLSFGPDDQPRPSIICKNFNKILIY